VEHRAIARLDGQLAANLSAHSSPLCAVEKYRNAQALIYLKLELHELARS
jgi:hypothetical protein